MEMSSQTNRLVIFIIVNLLLLFILYSIPINQTNAVDLCIYKRITGKECWNCGMTRAFLSVLRLDFKGSFKYNKNVIVVFPLTIGIYIHFWYKYIIRREVKKNG